MIHLEQGWEPNVNDHSRSHEPLQGILVSRYGTRRARVLEAAVRGWDHMGGKIDLRPRVLVDHVSLAEVGRFARFGDTAVLAFLRLKPVERPALERRIGSKVSGDILVDEN